LKGFEYQPLPQVGQFGVLEFVFVRLVLPRLLRQIVVVGIVAEIRCRLAGFVLVLAGPVLEIGLVLAVVLVRVVGELHRSGWRLEFLGFGHLVLRGCWHLG